MFASECLYGSNFTRVIPQTLNPQIKIFNKGVGIEIIEQQLYKIMANWNLQTYCQHTIALLQ